MRGAHSDVWCSKGTRLIEAELFAAESKRSAPDGRALLCAADNAREIQGITAFPKRTDARNRAPVTPVSLHISDVSAQRRVWGSQEGAREPYGALAPFCPRRRAAASPLRRETPAIPRRRAAALPSAVGTASPSPPGDPGNPPAVGTAQKGTVSTGCSVVRSLPPGCSQHPRIFHEFTQAVCVF